MLLSTGSFFNGSGSGGGAPAYDPATLFPSNGYWFDPSDSTFVSGHTVGSSITTFPDKSGNSHTLTATGTITFEHPDGYSVHCDGVSGKYLNSANYASTIAQPYYLAIGFKRTDTVSAHVNLLRGYPTVQTGSTLLSTTNYVLGAGTTQNTGVSAANTTKHVLFLKVNGASSQMWLDGTSVWTGDLGTQAAQVVYFFGTGSDTTHTFAGDIYQAILSDNAQMLTDRTSIESYINGKMAA